MIFEGAGLALVRVTDDVFRLWCVLDDELPLHAGREPRTAATFQTGSGDDLDHLLGFQRERLAQPFVALILEIEIEGVRVRLSHKFRQNRIHYPLPLAPVWFLMMAARQR